MKKLKNGDLQGNLSRLENKNMYFKLQSRSDEMRGVWVENIKRFVVLEQRSETEAADTTNELYL